MPKIVSKHPDVKLNICGGISNVKYYNKVIQTSKKLGVYDNLVFHKIVDRKKLVDLLNTSISLVIPSFQETTPTVICQAMAASRVPVASNVGGITGMIENNVTGYLIDPTDPDDIAGRLNELLDNPSKACKMGIEAKMSPFRNMKDIWLLNHYWIFSETTLASWNEIIIYVRLLRSIINE